MAKDVWDEMKYASFYDSARYTTDPFAGIFTNANENRGYELEVLRDRCNRMERDLIAERQKNKKLQEQLNELLEEMREC